MYPLNSLCFYHEPNERFKSVDPLDTPCCFSIYKTSMQHRIAVLQALKQRCVSMKNEMMHFIQRDDHITARNE